MNIKTDKETADLEIDVRKTFDIDIDLKVMAFKEPNEYVPNIDESYKFDKLSLIHISEPTRPY